MRISFAGACVALAGACNDGTAPSEQATPLTKPVANRQAGQRNAQFAGIEQQFATLADSIPGFAGYYYDRSGALIIQLADPSRLLSSRSAGSERGEAVGLNRASAAIERVTRALRAKDRRVNTATSRSARFTFFELANWRDMIRENAPDGTNVIDLDEEQNRVSVGVASASARARVSALTLRLGIPLTAVHSYVSKPVQTLQSGTSMLGQVRGVTGGVQIGWTGGTYCTSGVNAQYSGTYNVMLTASHCSKKYLQPDGAPSTVANFYQPKAQATGNYIGYEFADPMYFTGGVCPAGAACRWSDVLAAYYDPQTVTAYRKIVRPTGSPTYLAANTSFTIAGYFNVVDTWDATPVGEELQKVGATSGWTRGYITATCQDVNLGYQATIGKPAWILCSDKSDINAAGGDSGAPIFKWYGDSNNVHFVGILFAGVNGANITYHSGMYGISRDFTWLTMP